MNDKSRFNTGWAGWLWSGICGEGEDEGQTSLPTAAAVVVRPSSWVSYGVLRWLFHLREAFEADKCGRGFASSNVNDHRRAAVGVLLRQGSDEVATSGQAEHEATTRIGRDGAACARDGVAAGCTMREGETGVSEWAPGIAAGRFGRGPWAAE